MTTAVFIHEIEGYYSSYNPTQRKYVSMWLEKKSDRSRRFTFAEVVKLHSPSLRMPPGIAELEEAYKAIPEKRWREIESPVMQIEERNFTDEEMAENIERLKNVFHGLSEKKNIRREE